MILPLMLKEIREGAPDAKITLLIATGFHRQTTKEEMIAMFGEDIVKKEHIVCHDGEKSPMAYIGKLPSGGDIIINKLVADADFVCSDGFIEPHVFSGFSGGRKAILPGVASRVTVMANHNGQFIASKWARPGMTDEGDEANPIHIDMLYAARRARLDFTCLVVVNGKKQVVYAAAGDTDIAHRKGRHFLQSQCTVDAKPADIVVSTNGGYPLDQNLYQTVRALATAEMDVNPKGVIIIASENSDGYGNEEFFQTFVQQPDLQKMWDTFVKTPPEKTVADQWSSQIFARVILGHKVFYISKNKDDVVKTFHMEPCHSLEEAMKKAEDYLKNPKATVTAIPDGVAVIIRPKM
jgi:nickel-dependent lactate racemase